LTASGDQLKYDYSSVVSDLPADICQQFRFKMSRVTAMVQPSGNLTISAQFPPAMKLELLHVIFGGSDPSQDAVVPIGESQSINGGLSFEVSSPGIPDQLPVGKVQIGFETRGRYSTQRVKFVS
jgi:hypothetical protein